MNYKDRLRSLVHRDSQPGSAFRAFKFQGSPQERVDQVEPFCTWTRQYYSVTADLCRMVGARNFLEVGVAYGFHARYLLSRIPDLHYWGVDPYVAGYDNADTFALDVQSIFEGIPGDPMDSLFLAVSEALEAAFPGRSRLIRQASPDASASIADESQDVVFIDGNHLFEAVSADLAAWWPKVAQGGLLIGDDLAWPGVAAAVKSFMATHQVEALSVASTLSQHPLFLLHKN